MGGMLARAALEIQQCTHTNPASSSCWLSVLRGLPAPAPQFDVGEAHFKKWLPSIFGGVAHVLPTAGRGQHDQAVEPWFFLFPSAQLSDWVGPRRLHARVALIKLSLFCLCIPRLHHHSSVSHLEGPSSDHTLGPRTLLPCAPRPKARNIRQSTSCEATCCSISRQVCHQLSVLAI